MLKTPTKSRILNAGAELMWLRGFHAVGLNEILTSIKVPKGSFYHYFKSKEHFGAELLSFDINRTSEETESHLLSSEPDPLKRILNLLEASVQRFGSTGKCPSLVLKLAAEVVDSSEPMRQVITDGLSTWQAAVVAVLNEAKTKGYLPEDLDSESNAALIRDLWAGAIQRACILKTAEPMRDSLVFLRDHFASLQDSAGGIAEEQASGHSLPTNLL